MTPKELEEKLTEIVKDVFTKNLEFGDYHGFEFQVFKDLGYEIDLENREHRSEDWGLHLEDVFHFSNEDISFYVKIICERSDSHDPSVIVEIHL